MMRRMNQFSNGNTGNPPLPTESHQGQDGDVDVNKNNDKGSRFSPGTRRLGRFTLPPAAIFVGTALLLNAVIFGSGFGGKGSLRLGSLTLVENEDKIDNSLEVVEEQGIIPKDISETKTVVAKVDTGGIIDAFDNILQRNAGTGWKTINFMDSIASGDHCVLVPFISTTGKTAQMCVHSAQDIVSDSIRKHQRWGDCDPLPARWNASSTGAKNEVYVEIGANIGSCVMEMLLSTDANVVAFEPTPRNYEMLSRTIYLLGPEYQQRVALFPIALGSESTKSQVYSAVGNMGNSVVGKPIQDLHVANQQFSEPVDIFIERIDSILSNDVSVPLMKLDAQGFECQILDGMSSETAANIHVIKFEQDSDKLKQQGCMDLFPRLRSHGFAITDAEGEFIASDDYLNCVVCDAYATRMEAIDGSAKERVIPIAREDDPKKEEATTDESSRYYHDFELEQQIGKLPQSSPLKRVAKEQSNDCLISVGHVRNIRLYSQNDEDGALLQILRCMGGHGRREYFEFGSEGGTEVNTRILRDLYGWKGHLLDGNNENPEISLHKEFFTPSNIVSLLEKYSVDKELDVLSIDTDYDDFWTAREILVAGYKPRVLIIEYNVNFGQSRSVSVKPKPIGEEMSTHWKGDCYYGASAHAMILLMQAFGYTPVFSNDVNLIFVQLEQALNLDMMIPSIDRFPGPFARPLHANCSGRTWKEIDLEAVKSKASDPALSHTAFAASFSDIVLHAKVYEGNHRGDPAWRFFYEEGS